MKKIFNLLFEFSSCAALRRGAELLRDCVKSVRDNAAVYFTSLTLAARKEREFGDKLAATAGLAETLKLKLYPFSQSICSLQAPSVQTLEPIQ